jgi:UDP-N-acetyl-D-glucosamine dehydrogenase
MSERPPIEERLLDRIESKSARVAVMGLGYVGLPLSLHFAEAGFDVLGYDVAPAYVEVLRSGTSRIVDIPSHRLAAAVDSGSFTPSADPDSLAEADIYFICVPTPLSKTRQPDLSYIAGAIDTLAKRWRSGALVVLESTTYPGTTDEVLLGALQERGAELDHDLLLAFSPERVDPGNVRHPLHTIPKVVGGVSDASTRVASALYGHIFDSVHPVSNARAAELTKLLENTFRNVNIALANEFSQICDALDVDIWEVIDAAATKPFGFMPFRPGPGIGGHCIPLDPQYLVYKARLSGYEPRLVALADQINQEMPTLVVNKAMAQLNRARKALNGARVLVVGVAYKPGVPDTRESPALEVLEELIAHGADVSYTDPYVPELTLENGVRLTSVPFERSRVEASDLIIVTTDHGTPENALLHAVEERVLDTRNALGRNAAVAVAAV